MTGYIATIQVFVPDKEESSIGADSTVAAADFISETLRESGFKDWAYLSLDGESYMYPQPFKYDSGTYEEGDFLDMKSQPSTPLDFMKGGPRN